MALKRTLVHFCRVGTEPELVSVSEQSKRRTARQASWLHSAPSGTGGDGGVRAVTPVSASAKRGPQRKCASNTEGQEAHNAASRWQTPGTHRCRYRLQTHLCKHDVAVHESFISIANEVIVLSYRSHVTKHVSAPRNFYLVSFPCTKR